MIFDKVYIVRDCAHNFRIPSNMVYVPMMRSHSRNNKRFHVLKLFLQTKRPRKKGQKSNIFDKMYLERDCALNFWIPSNMLYVPITQSYSRNNLEVSWTKTIFTDKKAT